MRLPNFLVIGAQKAGTSWIHRFLSSRPDVFVPKSRKELWFFDNEARFSTLGAQGYAHYFEEAGDEVAIGEVTPGYLYVDSPHAAAGPISEFRRHTPKRVADLLGRDVRLIASLRNPVNRALSAFLHHRRKGRIQPGQTIGAWLEAHGILAIGFYGAHLARWAEVFPRSSFFLAPYEEFFVNPATRAAMLAFLGAQPWSGNELIGKRVHSGEGFTRTISGVFDASGAMIATISEISMLRDAYRPDVRRLCADWGFDASSWSADF